MNPPPVEVVFLQPSDGMDGVKTLFTEYQRELGIDLCFQGFTEELETLPGVYTPPLGALLVARVAQQDAGCCAVRPLPDCDYPNACEMKRLYVRPAFRGLGVGRVLVDQTLQAARQAGYSTMLLDTLSEMEVARALYAHSGFQEIAPYYHNPLAGAHYLKVTL